ncbi:hypothetical protein EV138_2745 [Kribbella voronezhensis]|uniref:Uncharacterized protein n=2 Tax=Kribbella voronezhensis TaxID=2512212 RepID=A0A4R7TB42_9ACTN|nr:hypothetical protein EV138_2745 [Kribbella voronezhensis]
MDAEAVVETLDQLLKTIVELEVAQVRGALKAPRSRWRFTNLGLGSLHATLAPLKVEESSSEAILDVAALRLVKGFAVAETEDVIPEGWTPTAVRRGRTLANGLKHHLPDGVTLTLVRNGEPVPDVPTARVTSEVAVHLKNALDVRQESIGSVVGMIGSINIHRRSVAGLWPERGGSRLEVTFNAEDLDAVRAALGQRVLVAGRLKRNGAGQIVRLDMRTLELLPTDHESLRELYGLDRELTDGLSSLEYLRTVSDKP